LQEPDAGLIPENLKPGIAAGNSSYFVEDFGCGAIVTNYA
jgi:hypothetical protein